MEEGERIKVQEEMRKNLHRRGRRKERRKKEMQLNYRKSARVGKEENKQRRSRDEKEKE